MDLQNLLESAVCQYKAEKYEVVVNIIQQANMIRNHVNTPMFLDFDILCFLSNFKLHDKPERTVHFFLDMCYAKGYVIMDKIYALVCIDCNNIKNIQTEIINLN